MNDDCPILDLRGDDRSRGRAHGEMARVLISQHIDGWRRTSEKQTGLPYQTIKEKFLGETHFAEAAQRWTPHLWTEVQGIAEGAGQDFEDVLVLNLTDEQWWFFAEKKIEACTAFAYRDTTGAIWSGQNLDITGWMNGLQVILRYDLPPATGGTAIAATLAGTIGMTGINSFGVSICCNTLLQLPPTPDGLPALMAIRGFLDQPTLAAGEGFLQQVRHASGLHYLVAGPEGWLGLECDADGTRRIDSGPDWYAHTNHPKRTPEAGSRSSTERLAAMDAALSQGDGIAALTQRPICRDGTSFTDPIGFTIFSALWQNRVDPVASIAPGPPDKARYRAVTLG